MNTNSLQQQLKANTEERPELQIPWLDYVKALAVVICCTIVCSSAGSSLHERNLFMIYLLGIVLVSTTWSRGASLFACISSLMLYDYYFVPPIFSFGLDLPDTYVTLVSTLVVSVLISSISSRLRQSAQQSMFREKKLRAINELNRAMTNTRAPNALAEAAGAQMQRILGCRAVVLLCKVDAPELMPNPEVSPVELGQAVSALTNVNANATADIGSGRFVVLRSTGRILGVLAVFPGASQKLDAKMKELIREFAEQLSVGIERSFSLEAAERAKLQVEGMKLRNSLLSSVSHDLRTPLASIMGAATSILCDEAHELPQENKELVQSIRDEADRLNKFLKNLLDMTRIESGAVQLKKEWQSVEESVGVALNRLRMQLKGFQVVTEIPDDLPLALYDEQLIDQVLFNLLDNAAKYAPAGSKITVWAKASADGITMGVSNHGCSLAPGAEARMFDKFYRGDASAAATYGAGLGLTICRGIMQAHMGQIWAERFDEDGISICFLLPVIGEPPKIDLEPEAIMPGADAKEPDKVS
jgi:two-component system sensor histidine kinase KdpD